MATLLTDPEREQLLRDERSNPDAEKWNEVWNGVLVMPTLPNDEHQELQGRLMFPLLQLFELTGLGKVRAGVNVTDRDEDWKYNFRGPDIVLYLPENPAKNSGSHWLGGPDFLVEIISPGDLAWDKLAFYPEVGTQEVLIVDRDPWRLELYQLDNDVLKLAGKSDLENSAILASHVVPLTFQLHQGPSRPIIHMVHTGTGQTWTA